MAQYKRLLQKSSLYFVGNFSSKLVNVALIPLYAYALSSDALGVYDYLLMLMSALGPFAFLAIWEAVLRYTIIKENHEQYKVIGTLEITFFSMVIGILILMFAGGLIFPSNFEYIILVCIMIICDGAAKVWQSFARGLEQNKDYVLSSIVSTLLNFLINVILLCVFHMGYYALFLAYTISQLTVMLFLEWKVKVLRYFKKRYWDPTLLKEMFVFSIPLVVNLSSVWLITGYGRTVVFAELGTISAGIYAFASKFGTIILTVGSVFSLALIEEAIIQSKEEGFSSYFSDVLKKIVETLFILLVLLVPVISVFYHMITNTEYASSIILFPVFLFYAVIISLSTSVGAVFQAVNKTKYQAVSTIIGSIVAVVLTHLFIGIWGIAGVAIAQTLGAITMLMLRIHAAYKYANIKIEYFKPTAWLAVFIVTSILCVKASLIYIILCFIGLLAVICIVKKEDINKIYIGILGKRKKMLRERGLD